MANTRESLKALKVGLQTRPLNLTDYITAPRAKWQQLFSDETTSYDKKQAIYDEV